MFAFAVAAAMIAAVLVDFDFGLEFECVDDDEDSSWVCGTEEAWDLFCLADFDLGKVSVALRFSCFEADDWSAALLAPAVEAPCDLTLFFLF